MKRFVLERSKRDVLTSHSGMALAGLCLNRHTDLAARANEQFHSELKTDLDVERLTSGKFATNALVLALAGLAYNILRLIGQIGLLGEFSPMRHPAKWRRLKTVMRKLMCVAARVFDSGRRLRLRFAQHCPALRAVAVVYHHLRTV